MPHVNQEAQTRLTSGGDIKVLDNNGNPSLDKYGELCYLFSQTYLHLYNENPKWYSVHNIRKLSRNVFSSNEFTALLAKNRSLFEIEDILVAADLAFFEFYRCVVSAHEDNKILENGSAYAGAKVPSIVATKESAVGNRQGIPGYMEV